jgi:hypothetical protein
MVVDDLDIVGIAALPAKADTPLIVDADTVLASSIAGKLLEPIGRRDPQVVHRFCRVQDQELAKRDPLDPRELPRKSALKDPLGLATAEALDHCEVIPSGVIIVKRYEFPAGPF